MHFPSSVCSLSSAYAAGIIYVRPFKNNIYNILYSITAVCRVLTLAVGFAFLYAPGNDAVGKTQIALILATLLALTMLQIYNAVNTLRKLRGKDGSSFKGRVALEVEMKEEDAKGSWKSNPMKKDGMTGTLSLYNLPTASPASDPADKFNLKIDVDVEVQKKACKTPTGNPVWKSAYDRVSARYYYYNTETGESSWTPPQELQGLPLRAGSKRL